MLLGWLQAFYGCQMGDLSSDAPLWVSPATNGTRGKRLSTRAIEQICQDRLGTGKAHVLRHSFARWKTLARGYQRPRYGSATGA